MAAYSSLHNQSTAGWKFPIAKMQQLQSALGKEPATSIFVDESRTLTRSPTAYEPSHLESDITKRNSTGDGSSVRTSTASWTLEIIAVIISVGAILAIVALLHRENGRPLSAWKLAVTLNTMVAALGTLARTTLAFALSACIGQQKWNWLKRKPDVLVAWERFDEASRGPWGGARLLLWLRARHWATLGALVTVGAIAFDPFLQAVISTHGQLDSISAETYPVVGQSLRIDSGTVRQVPGAAVRDIETGLTLISQIDGRADFGFISSVWQGFQNTSAFRNDAIGVECSTGNCTWPVYTSAAVCSSCEDVSERMVRRQFHGRNGTNVPSVFNAYEGDYVKFELPYANIRNYVGRLEDQEEQGRVLPTFMTANTTINATRTVMFKDVKTLLMAFTVMRAPEGWLDRQLNWEDGKPEATECAIYLCANAYETRSENSIVKERVLGSWVHKTPGSHAAIPSTRENNTEAAEAWVKKLGDMLFDGQVNRTDLQLLIPEEESTQLPLNIHREFNVSHAFIYSAMDYLLQFTKPKTQVPREIGDEPPDETWGMLGAPWWSTSQPVVIDALWNSKNLTITFDNVARSLTNQIRNSSPDRHQGELKQWVIHVHVDWAYLAYPVSMLVGGILYVVLTMIESRHLCMPVWKESALPTLLHGFDDETQRLLRADGKAAQRKALVRFEQDDEGYQRLVAQQ